MKKIKQRKYWITMALFLMVVGTTAELIIENGRALVNWTFIGGGISLLLVIIAAKIRRPIVLTPFALSARTVLCFTYIAGGVGYLIPPWEFLAILIVGSFYFSFFGILQESKPIADDFDDKVECDGLSGLEEWGLANWICGVGDGSGRNNRDGF